MADFWKVLESMARDQVSDILISPGEPVFVRKRGRLQKKEDLKLSEDDMRQIILKTSTNKAREILGKFKQVNYSVAAPDGQRYRIAAYFERNRLALSIRVVPKVVPQLAELGLPSPIKSLLAKQSGLIIVASPSGHGKSTTIASLLDFINHHFEKNVVTIENPVEMVFADDRSSFIQRSIPLDVNNFFDGLNDAYRIDPDVVMSDSLTYRDALEQALFLCEAGCLVIGGVDGGTCTQVLQRIIDGCPPDEQPRMRGKLGNHLLAMISQRLVTRQSTMDRMAVFDILVNTQQVKTLIRNGNLPMLRAQMEKDAAQGMLIMGKHLQQLVVSNTISKDEAVAAAGTNPEITQWLGHR